MTRLDSTGTPFFTCCPRLSFEKNNVASATPLPAAPLAEDSKGGDPPAKLLKTTKA